ncbi:MAG: toxin Cry1Ac domain D-VI-related protein [Coprobacillaceae bacterium]
MKKKISFKIVLTTVLTLAGIVGFSNGIVVDAATDPNSAPIDWAFTEDSVPLHDAILSTYPIIDTNADGFISISEAGTWVGSTIAIRNLGITGTINGIEHFTNPNLTAVYLEGNQFSGTIPSGIGNLTSLQYLYLYDNQFTGSVPSTLGNLTSLRIFYLQNNKLSGEIPSTLGNLSSLQRLYLNGNELTGSIPTELGNITSLQRLYLQNNKLTGSIPPSLGNLINMQHFNLYNNNLSGEIPSSLGNMTSVIELFLFNNQLTGEIPASIGTIPTLLDFAVFGNSELTGDVATIFNGSTTLRVLIVYDTATTNVKPQVNSLEVFIYDLMNTNKDNVIDGLTQTQIDEQKKEIEDLISIKNVVIGSGSHWDILIGELRNEITIAEAVIPANTAVDALYNNDKTDVADTTTLESINNAQLIVDTVPDGAAKDRLQEEINIAKNMLDAKDKVENLFTEDGNNIKETVDQNQINDAQTAVDKLPNGPLKDELQEQIKKAQDLLNKQNEAKDAVEDLFNPDGNIKDSVTQEDINNAQDLVTALPEGPIKDMLQDMLDEAQKQLDAKKEVPLLKPSVVPSNNSTNIANTINTTDTLNIEVYIVLLSLSLITLMLVNKKRNKV